jgi:hypothetical protein
MNNSPDYGYLQHGHGTAGPFRTERVTVRNEYADRWQDLFEGRWRRVHIRVGGLFIVYRGQRIAIQIERV